MRCCRSQKPAKSTASVFPIAAGCHPARARENARPRRGFLGAIAAAPEPSAISAGRHALEQLWIVDNGSGAAAAVLRAAALSIRMRLGYFGRQRTSLVHIAENRIERPFDRAALGIAVERPRRARTYSAKLKGGSAVNPDGACVRSLRAFCQAHCRTG